MLFMIVYDIPSDDPTLKWKMISCIEKKQVRNTIYLMTLDGINYYIKVIENHTLLSFLKDLVRSSKGMKFYVANFEMQKRGIPTAEAVFVVEKRHLFFKAQSIVATREISNTLPFVNAYKRCVQRDSEFEKESLLEELARLIYRLNKEKIAHADLLGNVLVKNEWSKLDFYIIDYDAVKLFDHLSKFDFIKHFEGFYWFFVSREKHATGDWKILCQKYIELDDTIAPSVEILTRHVARRKELSYYLNNRL